MSVGFPKLSSAAPPHRKRLMWPAALVVFLALGLYLAYPHVVAEYHYRAARKALQGRQFMEARAHVDVCLRTWPRSAASQLLAAQIARRAGFFEEADRRLTSADHLDGPIEQIKLERTLLQVQQGGLTEMSEALLLRYVQHDHHAESALILEALSQGCIRVFRNDSALKYLGMVLEMQPHDAHVLFTRGWVHDRMYNWESAQEDYAAVLEIDPDNKDALLRLAQALANLGKPQEAVDRFTALLERHPDEVAASFGLAQQLSKLGRFDQAQKILDDLAAKLPRKLEVLLGHGQLELNRGNPAAAESWLRRALEADPHDSQTNDALYRCLQALKKTREAEAQLKRLELIRKDLERLNALNEQIQMNPYESGLPLRLEVAQIFFRNGQDREGLIRLDGALRLDPNYRPALEALADYYEKKGDTIRAREYRLRAEQTGKREPS
ncbi:MAG TPA: tetratricopeptide repeat protein [Gemmataceae bacterium]|nr:tetratricopeptide repeat protein [Gemmataceae bacterium]